MENNIIKEKLICGVYWYILKVNNNEGVHFSLINTTQKEKDATGTTTPLSVGRDFTTEQEALRAMNMIIDFEGKVKADDKNINIGDGIEVDTTVLPPVKVQGKLASYPELKCGWVDGERKCIEYGFSVVGKAIYEEDKNRNNENKSDITITLEQCKSIKKIN